MSEYLEHVVIPSDTLPGLALKYNVSVHAIKQLNGLTLSNPNIFISSKVLKIPVQKTDQQENQPSPIPKQKLISQFAAQFKCSNFEAKQYLEENGYDLEKAIAARNEKIKPKDEDAPTEVQAPRIGGLTIHNANTTKSNLFQPKKIATGYVNKMEERSNDIFDL